MNKNPINYQSVFATVKEKHGHFIRKFSGSIEKALSDSKMEIDLAYARLSYVAKILQDAKVIGSYKEVDIMVEGTSFVRSLALTIDYGTCLIFLLNSGRNVFVYEGVALEHPGNLSFLVWSQNDQTKKYCNIFDDNFDWVSFSLYVTDVIHRSSYRRKEALENFIN